jgi:predicted transposase YdaD
MQFDATLKHLVELYPEHWLHLLQVDPEGAVSVIDADVSTVTAVADKVIRVDEPEPWLLQLEAQASYDPTLPGRLHLYSTLLSRRHDLPVRSVVLLLRPSADGTAMSGHWAREHSRFGHYLDFKYDIVRVWQLPSDFLVNAGIGVAPLSVLSDDATEKLPTIIQMSERLASDLAGSRVAAEIVAAEFILLGLRHDRAFIEALFHRVSKMQESTTYQAILEEGEERGVRRSILHLGTRRWGTPSAEIEQRLASVGEMDQLEALLDRLQTAESWSELFDRI